MSLDSHTRGTRGLQFQQRPRRPRQASSVQRRLRPAFCSHWFSDEETNGLEVPPSMRWCGACCAAIHAARHHGREKEPRQIKLRPIGDNLSD